jgi:hypothetical protein
MAVDAYVFVRNADLGTIERLQALAAEDPGVRVCDALSGPADAFVAIEAENVGAARRIIQGPLREAGARDTDVAYGIYPAQRIVRRWLQVPEYTAFTRIRVRPGRAKQVADAVEGLDGYLGSAAVTGSYDVLAAFEADDFDTLTEVILGQLHTLDDIKWSETAISQREGAGELS